MKKQHDKDDDDDDDDIIIIRIRIISFLMEIQMTKDTIAHRVTQVL